jgi:hypothetical protein
MYQSVELFVLIQTVKYQSGGNTAAVDFLHSQPFMVIITSHICNARRSMLRYIADTCNEPAQNGSSCPTHNVLCDTTTGVGLGTLVV